MRRLLNGYGLVRLFSCGVAAVLAFVFTSCGGSSGSTSTTTTTTTNQYAAAYEAIPSTSWGTGVTYTFSGCSMTVASTGVPPYHNAYYLAPAGSGQNVYATSPSGIQLTTVPYTGGISSVNKVSATFNICPTKASSTTTTSGGAIGFITSGEVLFDAYEATSTVALGDNVSYTFASTTTGNGCTGTACTASFIDACNSHPTGGSSGSTWHYHGVPSCWTTTVDAGTTGASHILGIALDGYPIYGGRDINGNAVAASSLDACNGITSATPEFPLGAYHYVLPLSTTTKQSSIGCYTGTVGASITAWAVQQRCKMLMAMQNDKWVPALPPLPGSIAAKKLEEKNAAAKSMNSMMAMAGMPGMKMPTLPVPPPATGSARVL